MSFKTRLKITYGDIICDDNSHNDTIDSHGLTKDDTDQVFGLDSWGFYTTSQDTGSSCKYTPIS